MRAEVFGKYQMLTRIASGGMAEVWLARSSSIGGFEKLLAIKRMHPNLSANQAFISMFIAEAKLTVQLNHPNIVQIFDFGQVEDDYFMAMEYVEGVDLAAVAKRCRKRGVALPVDTSTYILRGVMDGLTYAHTRKLVRNGEGSSGVIHRDISPQNILVSFDGNVKVSDFGIAQAISEIHNTSKGEVFGKLAYVSPEQCRGETVDEATDLWAAGVVLHELLTNSRLFARNNDYQTIEAVERGEIPSPRALNADVPEELDRLVLRMLERDPDKRLRSAREASEALAVIIGKNFPTATQFRLTEALEQLWDGALPRIVQSTEENTAAEVTRSHRARDERTKPVGDQTAAEIALVAARDKRQVRLDSAWTQDDSIQRKAVQAVVRELAEDRSASSTTALNPLEETYSGKLRSTLEVQRLKKLFMANPSLWILVDIGETHELAGDRGRALGAFKLAAAKFAQRGLLVQAASIYRRIMALVPLDERLREELKRLPSLQGRPDQDLLLEIFDPSDESADYSEYRDIFEANDQPVDVISESPILSSLSAEQFAGVVLALELQRYRPNQIILREGDTGDSFFMLGRGRVVVSATNYEGLKIYMTSLSDGDCFGEHGFFTGEPRNATVEAVEDVMLLEVSKEVLNRVIQEFPTVRESLRRFYKERIAESLLAKSQLFGHLSTRARKGLAERFTFETYERGDLVIREGDVSDAFYAIKSGRVVVYAGPDEQRVPLAELGPGEIFGEIAAIEGSRRTASVRTLEDCELLRLEAAELNAMLAKNIEIRRMIEDKIAERSEAKLQKMIDSVEGT